MSGGQRGGDQLQCGNLQRPRWAGGVQQVRGGHLPGRGGSDCLQKLHRRALLCRGRRGGAAVSGRDNQAARRRHDGQEGLRRLRRGHVLSGGQRRCGQLQRGNLQRPKWAGSVQQVRGRHLPGRGGGDPVRQLHHRQLLSGGCERSLALRVRHVVQRDVPG